MTECLHHSRKDARGWTSYFVSLFRDMGWPELSAHFVKLFIYKAEKAASVVLNTEVYKGLEDFSSLRLPLNVHLVLVLVCCHEQCSVSTEHNQCVARNAHSLQMKQSATSPLPEALLAKAPFGSLCPSQNSLIRLEFLFWKHRSWF